MDDLVKAIKLQLYERATSPLFSSFVLSWLAWNHRLFFVLFSDIRVTEKFDYINERLYDTWWPCLSLGFLFPLATSLGIILVLPYPARWVFEIVSAHQIKLKQIQLKVENETPLPEAEARALRTTLREAKISFEKAMNDREEAIEELKRENLDLRSRLDSESKRKEIKDISAMVGHGGPLEPSHLQLLDFVSKHPGVQRRVIAEEVDRDPLEAEVAIDELLENGLLEVLADTLHPTRLGRKILLDQKVKEKD
jgi:hypothetical protein